MTENEQGDRMDLMGRCDCADKPTDQAQAVKLDLLVSRFCKALGEPFPEDAIRRAEQLRGAVEALQAIAARSPFGTSSEAGAIAAAHTWLEKHGYPTTTGGQ